MQFNLHKFVTVLVFLGIIILVPHLDATIFYVKPAIPPPPKWPLQQLLRLAPSMRELLPTFPAQFLANVHPTCRHLCYTASSTPFAGCGVISDELMMEAFGGCTLLSQEGFCRGRSPLNNTWEWYYQRSEHGIFLLTGPHINAKSNCTAVEDRDWPMELCEKVLLKIPRQRMNERIEKSLKNGVVNDNIIKKQKLASADEFLPLPRLPDLRPPVALPRWFTKTFDDQCRFYHYAWYGANAAWREQQQNGSENSPFLEMNSNCTIVGQEKEQPQPFQQIGDENHATISSYCKFKVPNQFPLEHVALIAYPENGGVFSVSGWKSPYGNPAQCRSGTFGIHREQQQ